MIHCPKCNRIILDTTADGGYKMRTRMVLFHEGEAKCICPSCKTKVDVPVVLGDVPLAPPKPKHLITNKNNRD